MYLVALVVHLKSSARPLVHFYPKLGIRDVTPMQSGTLLGAEASCSGRTAFDSGHYRGRFEAPSSSTRMSHSMKLINNAKQLWSGKQLTSHSLTTTRHRCTRPVRAGADQVCSGLSGTGGNSLSCLLTKWLLQIESTFSKTAAKVGT